MGTWRSALVNTRSDDRDEYALDSSAQAHGQRQEAAIQLDVTEPERQADVCVTRVPRSLREKRGTAAAAPNTEQGVRNTRHVRVCLALCSLYFDDAAAVGPHGI